MRLVGKSVVITGAGSGLGRVSAQLFASEGARVVVADIDGDRARDTLAMIAAKNTGVAIAVTADVSSDRDIARVISAAVDEYGRIDVLFNNAGIAPPGNGSVPFEEIQVDDWDQLCAVNLRSVFLGCRRVVPIMRRAGGGSIINTSSSAALASPYGWAAYAATKGGVNALTRGLAVDVGRYNIRVNAICPKDGMSPNFRLPAGDPVVDETVLYKDWTPDAARTPLKGRRPKQMIDAAYLALFLASDESAYMSGTCIPIDGAALCLSPSGKSP